MKILYVCLGIGFVYAMPFALCSIRLFLVATAI